MKLAAIFLVLMLSSVTNSLAATVKLICKNQFGIQGGPLELDLEARIAYRYNQREPWKITGATDLYITMLNMKEVGGSIAVLDLASGELQMVDLGMFCNVGGANCTTALTKLQGFSVANQTCSKSLLGD